MKYHADFHKYKDHVHLFVHFNEIGHVSSSLPGGHVLRPSSMCLKHFILFCHEMYRTPLVINIW